MPAVQLAVRPSPLSGRQERSRRLDGHSGTAAPAAPASPLWRRWLRALAQARVDWATGGRGPRID